VEQTNEVMVISMTTKPAPAAPPRTAPARIERGSASSSNALSGTSDPTAERSHSPVTRGASAGNTLVGRVVNLIVLLAIVLALTFGIVSAAIRDDTVGLLPAPSPGPAPIPMP